MHFAICTASDQTCVVVVAHWLEFCGLTRHFIVPAFCIVQLDKAAADAIEYKAGYDKATADAAEFKAGYDKLLVDGAEQRAQVGRVVSRV